MKFDCLFIITKRAIRNAKVYAVPSEPFSPMSFACDTKNLLMKFDCFFIITERVIRNAKVYAVPSEPFSPMSFAILRDC